MVFSSFEFLFRFLPVFLIIYYITPAKQKNMILFWGSLVFYTMGEVEYVLLLVASVAVNYILGRLMYAEQGESKGWATSLLIVALCYDFGMLFVYKYSGLVRDLPLGISFYTFQIAAYTIDVYRKQIPAEQSFVKLGTYLTMFPQLVAGPIINYCDVKDQLIKRTVTAEDFEDGLKFLILGLGAKVIVADRISLLWNHIRSIGCASISVPLAWMGAFAYSIELYFDFAGYSMMAKGLGKMLGFTIPQNFNLPYISRSISEFWRRWHITLGKWFREYVYIPLGGNRGGKARTFFNLFVVWVLTACWHGIKPNFLLWGASLLFFLALEKLFLLRFLQNDHFLCRFFSHLYVLFVIPVTWVLFAIEDVGQLRIYLMRLFPFLGQTGVKVNTMDFVECLKDYWLLFAIGILFSTPLPRRIYRYIRHKWVGTAAVAVIFVFSVYYLAISKNNPFLYFNF